ncbi:hypothetical protein QT06_C0001G0174 [archaeon GW2011_AR15]|nr:hypothetical protein QT06_C0001G0174 [archaeon GW2011_AR15]
MRLQAERLGGKRMNLPKFYFFNFSGITIVHSGRIYTASSQVSDFTDEIAIESLVDAGPESQERFPLEPQETLLGLEALYFIHNNSEIGKWQAEYMKKFNIDSLSDIDMANRIKESKLLEFIVKEVFPRFVSSGRIDIEGMGLNVKAPSAKKKSSRKKRASGGIAGTVFDIIEGIENEGYTQKDIGKIAKEFSLKRSILQSDVLGNESICIIDNEVYVMRSAKSEKVLDGIQITLGPKKFGLVYYGSLSTIETSFSSALGEHLKKQAFKNNPVILRQIEIRDELLKEIKNPKYQEAGLGIEKTDKDGTSYMISIDVPEFVNLGESQNYFYFPATKVGLQVWIQGEAIRHSKKPIVMGKYKHPFVGDWSSNRDICTDEYESSYTTPEERIADYLNYGKNILMSGYFGSVRPRALLNKSTFHESQFRKVDGMSREEIIKQYPITNVIAQRR